MAVAKTKKKKKQKLDAGAGSAAAASYIQCDPQNPVHGLSAGGLSGRMLEKVAAGLDWKPSDFHWKPKLIAASSFHVGSSSTLDSFQMCSVNWNDQKKKVECIPKPLHLRWKPANDGIDPNLIKFMIKKNGLAALLRGIANNASCFRREIGPKDLARVGKIVEEYCDDFYSNNEIVTVDHVSENAVLIKFRASYNRETLPSGLYVVINQMKKDAQGTQLCHRTRWAMQKLQNPLTNDILLIVELGRLGVKNR